MGLSWVVAWLSVGTGPLASQTLIYRTRLLASEVEEGCVLKAGILHLTASKDLGPLALQPRRTECCHVLCIRSWVLRTCPPRPRSAVTCRAGVAMGWDLGGLSAGTPTRVPLAWPGTLTAWPRFPGACQRLDWATRCLRALLLGRTSTSVVAAGPPQSGRRRHLLVGSGGVLGKCGRGLERVRIPTAEGGWCLCRTHPVLPCPRLSCSEAFVRNTGLAMLLSSQDT